MSSRIGFVVFTLSIIININVASANGATWFSEGVSPGAVDRIAEIEGRCPTFFWGGEPEATAFELVVYRLPEGARLSGSADIDLTTCEEVLYARVPGSATAWQPELAEALHPGESYVWYVRAIIREEQSDVLESSEWSPGRFFTISPVVSASEVEQALGVLRQYIRQGDSTTTVLDSQDFTKDTATTGRLATIRQTALPAQGHKSVPTATSAIMGTVPDTSGETFGVIGISNSPDGAGLGAANTAGGPDLVLDGSEDYLPDAELSESGINRPWGTPQTFNIRNSMGAGLTLQVDGVDVITTDSELDAGKLASGTVPDGRLAGSYSQALNLSNPANSFTGNGAGIAGVDADTVGGLSAAAFSPAGHQHDERYFTESELTSAGAGGAVHWENLTAVPAGFADGIDNDTTYSFGPGLIIEDGQIRIDLGLFHTRVSTLDSDSNVSFYTSIAIGDDGLGIISYHRELKVAHCNDTACSSATTTTIESIGFSCDHMSIAIGDDGLGIISYRDSSNRDLKVAHCTNTVCSSATITTIDSTNLVGSFTSIAIGDDGLGIISYYDETRDDLKVAHCNDTACSSATTTTIDSTGYVGEYTSIAIGDDGLGIISYLDFTNRDLKVAHCNDTACSSATTTTIDSTNLVGSFTSIAIGDDGLGIVSYFDETNSALKVARCNDTICSSASIATIDSNGYMGKYNSIAIGDDGLGIISYLDFTNCDLKVAHLGIGVP